MPFINKVTVRGTTYFLENLTDGSNIAKLPTAAQGLKANDILVTEGTLGKFTVTPGQLEDFKNEVETNFSDLEQEFSGKFETLESGISEDMTQFQKNITDDIGDFKAEVDKLVRYELPIATDSILGGVKAAIKDEAMTREVGVDADGKLWVATDIDAAKEYTDSKAYSVEIVDVLPTVEDAEDRTFYLIPKTSGNGYEKYWKITDADGNSQLDEFAGSSTEVVSELPTEGEIDVDYIVYDGNVCLYYKWISGNWCMVAGSVAKVLQSTDELEHEVGNKYTDYYVKNGEIYFHYRWDNETSSFAMVGSDSYNKTEIDDMVRNINTAVGNNADDIETNRSTIASVSSALDSLTSQFNALDTEGYTYEADYGKAVLVDGGDEVDNVFTLYEIKEGVKTVKNRFVIQGGGGGAATTSKITFERITPSPAVFTKEDKVEIKFTFSSVDEDNETVDGTYTWKIGNQVIAQGNLKQGENVMDLTEYAIIGTQKFSLTMVDANGTMAVKTWTIQVIDVRIESDFKDSRTYTAGSPVNFTYKPYGSIPKTVHFKLDGVEIGTANVSASGTQQTYTIPAHEHGTHLFEAYITATVNDIPIETDHIYRDIIWYNEESEQPIVGCIYRYDHYGVVKSKQYNSLSIDYHVFDPNTSTPTVELIEDGVVVSTLTLESSANTWVYKSADVKEHILQIKCIETVVEIHVDVVDLGYTIAPVVANLAFDFNPVGKSNSDVDKLWKDASTGVTMYVSDNFDWSNGGYQLDSDGNQYFCIKAGTTATINYNLFANDLVMEDGAEFKCVFKTTNVGDPNAKFLTCKSGADIPVGIEMGVHSANMYAGSTDKFLNIPYSEDDTIEFDLNINTIGEGDDAESYIMTYEDGVPYRPLDYTASNRLYQQDPVPIVIGSTDCDVHIYRMKAYSAYLSDKEILDNFIADAPNAEEMIARYERNDIYDENGNLDPDKLAEKCPQLKIIKITCPQFTVGKDNKVKATTIQCVHVGGDPVLDNWTAVNSSHSGQGTTSDKYGISGRNVRLIMNNDNTEITMGDGTTKYVNGEGKVTLTRTSVPNNFFNIKLNIASSENANNALLANRYERYLPYQTVANKRDSKTKTTMEFVNCIVFVKEIGDLAKHTEFQDNEWHYYGLGNLGDDKKTDKTRANDPKDVKEFTVEIADNTMPCSEFPSGQGTYPIAKEDWTVGNTAYDNIFITANDEEGEFKTFGNGTYEFRYEAKGITDEQRAANIQTWCDFYGWVVTATDEEFVNEFSNWFIEDAALYYYLFTERYTMTDNRAKNSFWHYSKVYLTEEEAESDYYKASAQYYEIDNEKASINNGYRFDFWGYDFDTGLGIDNNGVLNRPYGKEDIDLDENNSYIFNGARSTFFMRIRNLMQGGLTRVYNAVKEAWSAVDLINEFDAWQSEFPEEIWRKDFERKYYRPFTGESIDNSIPKLDRNYLKERYNGRKKYHRRQFERDQEIYMGTKYLASSVTNDTNDIMFRVNSPVGAVVPYEYKLKIIPYIDMYVSAMFGNATPQQIRAKAGQEVILSADFEKADDTMINIYAANRIMELDGIAPCYIKTNRFGNATKLKKLTIGNHTPGYSNPYMETLNLGNNYLLKELDLTGCDGLKGELNMTKLGNLETLIADGTSLESVTFATNGKINSASLPATITTAIMKNLNYLTDDNFVLPTNKLDTFTEENCPYIDEKSIVEKSIKTLTEVRLTGIDWILESTDLLNKILNKFKNHLAGKVHIAGGIRQRELDAYADAWPDLKVTYNSIITQYPATFLNWDGTPVLDKNGNPYVQYVDQGYKPYDPTDMDMSTPVDIDRPTRESTAENNFTFAGWHGLDVMAQAPITVTALYTSEIRTYTVRWLKMQGVPLVTKENVPYGFAVEYDGEWPTMTDNEDALIFNVFAGWDKSTGFISGDTDVYAKWETANGLPSSGTDIKKMSVAQIYGVATSGNSDNYFEDGDYIDIKLGNDYSYKNDNIIENIIINNSTVLNGTESKVVESDIKLCGSDSPAFTMAIDFEFGTNDTTSPIRPTLVSCFENANSKGLRLFYGADGNPAIQWGDQSMTVGRGTQRNMVVIRHEKGKEFIHVYAFNSASAVVGSYSADIDYQKLTRTTQQFTDRPVIIGGFRYDPEAGLDVGKLGGLCKGTVHWVKIWNEDLGDADARNLAAWTHETVRFQYCGSGRYQVNPNTGRMTGASFICENLLTYNYHINSSQSNVGGWEASEMRDFCNERIYDAFPTVWKSIIKKPYIPANIGNDSTTVVSSQDYIYLPSCKELNVLVTTVPYNNEGSVISWICNDDKGTAPQKRIKTQNGVAAKYWTRSAYKGYDRYWTYIAEDGSVNGNLTYAYTQTKNGICPCFSI